MTILDFQSLLSASSSDSLVDACQALASAGLERIHQAAHEIVFSGWSQW